MPQMLPLILVPTLITAFLPVFQHNTGIRCFIVLHFIALHRYGFFDKLKGKNFHQQKDYDLLYCDTQFIAMIWNRTRNISEVCLYSSSQNKYIALNGDTFFYGLILNVGSHFSEFIGKSENSRPSRVFHSLNARCTYRRPKHV